jgi:hypothetical protein
VFENNILGDLRGAFLYYFNSVCIAYIVSEIILTNKLGKPTEFKSRIRLLHSWDGYNTSIQWAYLWSIEFLIRPIHDVYFIFQQVNLSFDLMLYRVCAALIQIENRAVVVLSLTRLGLRLRAKSLSWLSNTLSR